MPMHASPAAPFLRTIPLFSELSDAEISEIAWASHAFEYERGERLFRQGAAAEEMYCIEHGRVRLSVRMPGGSEKAFREIGSGEFFGEMALMDGGPRSASADAIERTAGYTLSGRAFEVLRAAYRPGALKVLRRLAVIGAARLRVMSQAVRGGSDPGHPPLDIGGTGEVGAPGSGEEGRVAPLRSSTADLDRDTLLFLPVFRDFTRDEIEELLQDMHCVAIPRHHTIFQEGDPPGSCFVVIRGAVQVSVEREGESKKLALLGPGKVFGELALFDPSSRAATCVARENSLLLEMERDTFNALMKGESVVAFKFFDAAYQLLIYALRNANRRSVWLSAQDGFAHP